MLIIAPFITLRDSVKSLAIHNRGVALRDKHRFAWHFSVAKQMCRQNSRISAGKQYLFTVLGVVLFVTLIATKAFAQQQCPNVEVTCSNRIAGERTPLHCTAKVSDDTGTNLAYQWSAVPATLVYHFDMLNEIDVDLGKFPDRTVTVMVTVVGLREGCRNTAEFYSQVTKSTSQSQMKTEQQPVLIATCAEFVTEGTPAHFSLNVNDAEQKTKKAAYRWRVSPGNIISGQGTSSIIVDTTDLGNQLARADVHVEGIGSPFKVSCTTSINPAPKAYKLDEYRSNNFAEETDHLSRFGLRLLVGLNERAYIIVYAGRGQATGEAKKLAEQVRDYLVKEYDVDPGRIEIIDGGFRKNKTVELWVVQAGAAPPVTDRQVVNPRKSKIKVPGR